jgi:signal transduction histidine kinase
MLVLIPISWLPNVNMRIYLPVFLLSLFAGVSMPVLLAFRMLSIRRRQALFFLLAFAAYLVVDIFVIISLIQRSESFYDIALSRGAFIWALFIFSIVINDHIGEVRRQKEQAQENLLAEQQESLRVKTEFISELENKNAELERFTYTVSHDLKTPLVTIGGFLGSLERASASRDIEQHKKDIQRIQNAVNRMQQLLSELLELSRIGRMMNKPRLVPFNDLVDDALENTQGNIESRGIAIQVQPNLPAVYGDKSRLTEVLQNLIDNAAKYMGEQTSPQIEISQRGEEDGMPVFFVRDNGIGIASEYHDQVFGLFNKLDASSEGTGVGLAIVKRIVEFHGGRIWVESDAGKGATFYFTLATQSSGETL